MHEIFPRISNPELFFGLVAPIGVDLQGCIKVFKTELEGHGYRVIEIKVTGLFKLISKFIPPQGELKQRPLYDRYVTHISYGNQIRQHFGRSDILAAFSIARLLHKRAQLNTDKPTEKYTNNAYIIHQFKRREEIDLFRSIYGNQFFQVSVYSRRGARVDWLARSFASSENHVSADPFRVKAEEIIRTDEDEKENEFGQRVTKIFHDGDFIVNMDAHDSTISHQISRFCNLLFGANNISPSKLEYGMFIAKAAAMRTLDLSRQVGAAIFSGAGEVISLGSNEVPKACGGTYWADDPFDDREWKHGYDSNYQRKKEILSEIAHIIDNSFDIESALRNKRLLDSQFMDALEYGRIVHAEMSAISDAARLGRSLKDAILFCTTFPCHMCAKHIVSSGIKRVIFLEPYPKSLAADLHSDSISIEGSDRGKYDAYPMVEFSHFFGVSPRRYREMFERTSRKDKDGKFQLWIEGVERPYLNIKYPFYAELERALMENHVTKYMDAIKMKDEHLREE